MTCPDSLSKYMVRDVRKIDPPWSVDPSRVGIGIVNFRRLFKNTP
jgi:hypothetical protein